MKNCIVCGKPAKQESYDSDENKTVYTCSIEHLLFYKNEKSLPA